MDRIKKLSNQLGKKTKAFSLMVDHSYGDVLRKMRRSGISKSAKNEFKEDGLYNGDESSGVAPYGK